MRIIVLFALFVAMSFSLFPHCQVPCGIYGDDLRFSQLQEAVETIKKAMGEMENLTKEKQTPLALQQFVRWTKTKEEHAQSIQQTMLDYFLAQRIKVPTTKEQEEKYIKELKLIHEIIVTAMKCKQSVDKKYPEKLHQLLHTFQEVYTSQK